MKKLFLVVTFFWLSNFNAFSQKTDCEELLTSCRPAFTMQTYVPTESGIKFRTKMIEDIKYCIEQSRNLENHQLSRLHMSLANNLYFEDSLDHEPIVSNVLKSFNLDTIGFCKSYVSVVGDYGPIFISTFNKYFIDIMKSQEIDKLKNYCLSNFEVPEKVKLVDEYSNETYRKVLDSISIMDQEYRNGFVTDLPPEQDVLDQNNRMLIDELFEKYGFPTEDQVGLGTNTVYHVMLHSKDCEWNKKWIELFIQNRDKNVISDAEIAWFFDRFFKPKDGFCLENGEGKRFVSRLLKKYSKVVAKEAGYLDYYPEFNFSYEICDANYNFEYSIRRFSKGYIVDNSSIQNHLNCVVGSLSNKDIPEYALGYMYNEIAQDYYLLGNMELSKEYIDKMAAKDLDLLDVLVNKYYQDPTKDSYTKPYYLNEFDEYINSKYGIKYSK